MSKSRYLIFHKDHLMDVRGVNSGAEMATLCLARFLAKAGQEVVVCAQLKDGEETHQGVKFWDLGPDFNIAGALQRARDLGNYHLISAGRAVPVFASRGESQCLSRSLITHDRSGNDTGIKPAVLMKVVDNVICVSHAQKQSFCEGGIDSTKVTVIHNGVDLDQFSAGDPEQRDYRKLVFVGALVRDKGLELLIPAFVQLKQKYHDLTLDCYGSAALWGREKFFDEREVERQVPGIKFHGGVSQSVVVDAFKRAGICTVPSIWFDPFPLTSIEAQVTGCPVVTFDVGGLKEGVRHGETGIVLQDVSQAALTQCLDSLLSQPAILKKMSERALATARSYFNWERVANSVIELCEAAPKRLDSADKAREMSAKAGEKSAAGKQAAASDSLVKKKLGVLSTWNQECGLATYAKFLFGGFSKGSYVVFSEDAANGRKGADEPFVERCWQRQNGDYERLYRACLRHDIGLLHINLHQDLFVYPNFSRLLSRLRAQGIKVVFTVHSVFTSNPRLKELAANVDCVLAHTPEVRLEVIANGADPAKVKVMMHGVDVKEELSDQQRAALKKELGLAPHEKALVCFGFIQPHKGMEALVEAVAQLTMKGLACRGYVAGKPMADDPNSQAYLEQLKALAAQAGIADRIVFLNRFLDDDEVTRYLMAADLVIMNYHSQYFEASGACSLAVGAGAVVTTSIAPAFMSFTDAVWHITAGYTAGLSAEVLLTNPSLRAAVKAGARHYCRENSWPQTVKKLQGIYESLNFAPAVVETAGRVVVKDQPAKAAQPGLRVLIQNRPTTFSMRGGDTFLIEKTMAGLQKKGVAVTVDLEGRANPKDFDLVHLFNFVLPEMVRAYGERALAAGVPFVVTTLCEDVPMFHNQSITAANALLGYVYRNQDRAWYAANKPDLKQVPQCPSFDNSWTVEHAAALFTNGARESAVLRRQYGAISKIVEIKLGYDIGEEGCAADFVKEYGVKDFIFCVGRLETRKNQLMLLKALEDSELPVVLAGGGFTYQPQYAEAINKFRRKGKTIVLGKLSAHMLASAYRAAKVHVLPSWYELPGLVSLEAAYYGCRVVATNRGTTPDYFGDEAYYCDPADEASIYSAVSTAYDSPLKPGLKEVAMGHSWDNVGENTLQAYQSALGVKAEEQKEPAVIEVKLTSAQPAPAIAGYDMAGGVSEFQEILERGELAAKKKDYNLAHEWLERAVRLNPQSVRALRARGAVFFAESNAARAREYFEKAFLLDQHDSRTLSGLGMCEMYAGAPAGAYKLFVSALEIDGDHLVSLLQLIECSYALNRYDDLIRILTNYTDQHPGDLDMRYCLAGAVFKQGWLERAEFLLDGVLQANPNHLGAKQLKAMLVEHKSQAGSAPAQTMAPAAVVPTPAPAAAAPVAALQTPSLEPPASVQFDANDQRLQELDEEKKKRSYQNVLDGCGQLMKNGGLRRDQIEKANLLTAEVNMLEGRMETASAMLEEVLRQNPKSARAMCGKGALAATNMRWDEARALFEQAHKTDAGYDVPLAGLGLCSAWAKDYSQAWSFYQAALQRNPENIRALLGMLEIGYPLKKLAEVEKAIKNYLEIHPCDLDFCYSLAGCYFAQNKLQEAIDEINKITLFEPSHEKALELRSMIEEKVAGVSL